MRIARLLIIPLCLSVLAMTAVACGDDDDRLTDEEYFAEVDSLNGEFQRTLEESFNAETAREGVDIWVTANDTLEEGIRDINPPEDIEDAHERYLEAVDATTDTLEGLAEETDEDAPIEELEPIIFGEDNLFDDMIASECELTAVAEERDIPLESLFCDQEDAEEEGEDSDAGDNPVEVEGTEFEFSFEDGALTTETTGIVFTNSGEQPHQLIVEELFGESARPSDKTDDEIVDEIVEAIGNDEELAGTNPVARTLVDPGGEATLAFQRPLTPGRYAMICGVLDEESGEPHAALGMAAVFTVE